MIIGFDYWQVLSHYPKEFQFIISSFISEGSKVCVISAVGENRRGTVAQAVRDLGFRSIPVHEVVFNDPSESPQLKLELCQRLGIQMFFDDRDDVCRLLNANGIVAMRVTRKDNSTYDLQADQK